MPACCWMLCIPALKVTSERRLDLHHRHTLMIACAREQGVVLTMPVACIVAELQSSWW